MLFMELCYCSSATGQWDNNNRPTDNRPLHQGHAAFSRWCKNSVHSGRVPDTICSFPQCHWISVTESNQSQRECRHVHKQGMVSKLRRNPEEYDAGNDLTWNINLTISVDCSWVFTFRHLGSRTRQNGSESNRRSHIWFEEYFLP